MKESIACSIAANTVVVILVLCSSSCSRSHRRSESRGVYSCPAITTDLGVVELSTNAPKHLALASGDDCVITLARLPDGKLQMNLAFEKKTGDATQKTSCQVPFLPGEQVKIPVRDMVVGFVPKLNVE